MTKEEITICKMYLEEMGKDKDCNEYKLLMQMLEQQPNDDCVSRQAVLEELQACVDTESMYDENNGLTYICYEDAVNWVEELPPVKATHGTCKDCKHCCFITGTKNRVCEKHGCMQVSNNWYCADYEKRGGKNDI